MTTPSSRAKRWRAGATTSIRVPAALADQVLSHARSLDAAWVAPPPPATSALPERLQTPPLAPPAWVKDAVFYQIFVDRFANGDATLDPAGVKRWGTKPGNFDLYGGDLAGVLGKLDYLQALGITAIYFNPLFAGGSNHKYDTTDYTRIDPHFGSNAAFDQLLTACQARGIRVILDGVFNHTGDRHAFFRDAVRRGPQSPYWHWYSFHDFPIVKRPRPNYEAWWGYAHLPKLRVAENRAVQEYIFEVTEAWTRKGIDGWRLDVPTEIASPAFWAEWRARVRAINPEAYLVGEIWEEQHTWIGGRPFDALTNYPFRTLLLDFFAHRRINVDTLDARYAGLRQRLGEQGLLSTFNVLASHDVPRLLTEAGAKLERVQEAVFFQLVSPGAPVIYYGEELGLLGGKDPDNRRCMPWSKIRRNPLLEFYRKLLRLRAEHPALRGLGFRTAFRHNDYRLYGFWREGGDEVLLVLLNSGTRPHGLRLSAGQWPDGTVLVDHLGGARFVVTGGQVNVEHLAPHTGLILGPVTRLGVS